MTSPQSTTNATDITPLMLEAIASAELRQNGQVIITAPTAAATGKGLRDRGLVTAGWVLTDAGKRIWSKANQADPGELADQCLGMPPGFESPCGQITEPHGPHPLASEGTADSAVQLSKAASDLFDQVDPSNDELNYLAGWLMSSAPDALTDALHAVVARRIQRSKNRT